VHLIFSRVTFGVPLIRWSRSLVYPSKCRLVQSTYTRTIDGMPWLSFIPLWHSRAAVWRFQKPPPLASATTHIPVVQHRESPSTRRWTFEHSRGEDANLVVSGNTAQVFPTPTNQRSFVAELGMILAQAWQVLLRKRRGHFLEKSLMIPCDFHAHPAAFLCLFEEFAAEARLAEEFCRSSCAH